MENERSFLWSTLCAWGLTGAVAVMGVAGAAAMFVDAPWLDGVCVAAFALMAALAILNANNAAAAAMQAMTADRDWRNWHWPTLAPALICAAGFAVASNVGVHLGWGILAASAAHPEALPSDHEIDMAALFLCFAKPAMSWVVEGRRVMDRASVNAAADKREASERAAALARRQQDLDAAAKREAPAASTPVAPPAPVKRRRASASASRATARALKAAALGGEAPTPQALVTVDKAPPLPLTEDELRAATASLVNREGANVVSIRAVAREAANILGRPVPPTQVERHPKRRDIFEAAKAA